MHEKDITVEYISRMSHNYKSVRDFYLKEPELYKIARRKNWLGKVLFHFKQYEVNPREWAEEDVWKRVKQHTSLKTLYELDEPAYDVARRKGMLKAIRKFYNTLTC